MDGRRSCRLAHRGLLTPALRRPALLLSSRQPRLKKTKQEEDRDEAKKKKKEKEDEEGETKNYAGLLCALGRNRSTAPPKKQDGFSHLSSCRRLPSRHYARGGIMSTKRRELVKGALPVESTQTSGEGSKTKTARENFRYGRGSSGSVYLPAALLIASNKPACHFAMGYLGETDKNHKLTNTCDTRRAI